MRVLVIGGTNFIGPYVVAALGRLRARSLSIIAASTSPRFPLPYATSITHGRQFPSSIFPPS